MYKILKNILAVIAGIVIGSAINMGFIVAGGEILPLPTGINPMNAELWELKYFLFPFLAHAIGTLSGTFITAKLSASYHKALAYLIGAFFLAGGIAMVYILPAPSWFINIDLIFAYIPMAWIGVKLAKRKI